MSAATKPVQEAAIRQYAKHLRMPTLGSQFARLAEQAVKEKRSHLAFLEALLEAEVEERGRKAMARRIRHAGAIFLGRHAPEALGDYVAAGADVTLAPIATPLSDIYMYRVKGAGYTNTELRSLQDWFVRYQINALPGVAEVGSIGGFVRQYQIDVSPDRSARPRSSGVSKNVQPCTFRIARSV